MYEHLDFPPDRKQTVTAPMCPFKARTCSKIEYLASDERWKGRFMNC